MRKHRAKRPQRRLPDPHDVLDGRVTAGVEEFFDLIHAINPTQRQLAAKEKARRYQLKSRLQSLLIRRFGDQELTVTIAAAPHSDGRVISLDHRSGVRDACHAVLDELEPDARAWAQRQLDLQALPEAPEDELTITEARSDPDDRTASVGELLNRAQRAIDEFDYEAAETRLALAFERSQGAAEAAQPYLELLVELLGLDDEALRLEPLLASDALQVPSIRAGLALAAARVGVVDKAVELVRGVEATRAAAVYAVLAEQAIRDQDRSAARRYLDRMIEHDPAHSDRLRLEQGLDDVLATQHQPAEAALRARFEQEGALAVEAEARALGELWSASEVVRQVLREAAELHRQAAADRHVERGDQAFAEQRYDAAAGHWRQAIAAGSERPDLATAVAEAERLEREREATERVESVVVALRDDVDRDALLAFVALPKALRQRAREQHSVSTLAWLETMGPPASGARAQAMVNAVLALTRSRAAFEQDDLRLAVDELSPHLKELKGVAEAQQIHADALRRLALAQRLQARSVLASAQTALEASRLDDTSRQLDDAAQQLAAIELPDLVVEERRQVKELRARLEHAHTVQLLTAEIERLTETGDMLAALARGRELLEHAAADERPAAHQRVTELEAAVQDAWRVDVVTGEGPLSELSDVEPPYPTERASVWLDEAGRRLLVSEACGHWLFLRWVDLERGTVCERVSLRLPERLGARPSVMVEGERIWILGSVGDLLEIACRDWKILSWRSLEDLLPDQIEFLSTALVPGSLSAGAPMVWVDFASHADNGEWMCSVADLNNWRIQHHIVRAWSLPLVGQSVPRAVSAPLLGGAQLHDARGKEIVGGLLPLGGRLQSVTAAPTGTGLLLVDRREPRGDKDDEAFIDQLYPRLIRHSGVGVFLVWAEPTEGSKPYRVRTSVELASSPDCGGDTVATASDQGLSFVLVDSGTGRPVELRAFEASDTGLSELYRVEMPAATDLIQDAGGRWVVAVCGGADGLQIHPLSRQPPAVDVESPIDVRLPISDAVFDCDAFGVVKVSADDGAPRNPGGDLESDNDDEVVRWLAMCHLTLSGSAIGDVEVDQLAGFDEARETLQTHPRRFTGAYMAACEAAKLTDWGAVEGLLAVADRGELEERHQRHYHHLRGLVHLHQGRDSDALAAFEQAARHPGSCELDPLLDLTRPMLSAHETEAEAQPGQPGHSLTRQLIQAIRSADEAFEAGDLETARRVLERPVIWQARELQSSARRARIWLETPTTCPRQRFAKRRALAQFFDLHELGRHSARTQIRRSDLSWDSARLAVLAERAGAWLET